MKTKEKILQNALELFNNQGVSSVSLRDIAQSAGISKGNVGYHFPLKSDIVYQLYSQMKIELTMISKDFSSSQNLLESILYAPVQTYHLSYKYRFLHIEYVHILQQYSDIKKEHHLELEQRKAAFQFILKSLQTKELIREEIKTQHWDILMQQSGLIRTTWFIHTAFQNFDSLNERQWNYIEMVNQLLWPYLTNTGQMEYDRINNEIKKTLL